MAIAKKPTRSTDPNVRKSPPFSASQFLVGHISVGNDGNNWIIVESANGVKRWAPYKKSASTAKATSSSKVVSQFEVNDLFVKQDGDDNWKLFYIKSIEKHVSTSNDNVITISEIDTDITDVFLETTLQGFLDKNVYIYKYIPQVGDIIVKDSLPKPLQITIDEIDSKTGLTTVSSKMSKSSNQTYTKKEFTRLLVNKGLLVVNFDPNTRSSISKTVPSTPAVETQQEALDRFNTYINNTSNIYYTLPRTNIIIYVEDSLNIPRFQALIGNTVAIDENDIVFKKELQDYLAQSTVITNVKILPGGRADITDFTFEFDPDADSFETRDALNDLDNWLYDKMNVRNGIQKNAIIPVTQAPVISSNDELKRLEDLLASSGTLYATLPKSGVKIYEFNDLNKNYQFYIQLDEYQDKYLIEKFLREKIKDFESVKEVTIAILRTGNLLHVIIEFDDTISRSTRLIEISILDNYLSGDLGIKPVSTPTTSSSVDRKLQEFVDQLSANGSLYYTLPKTQVKVYQNSKFSSVFEFAIELSPGHTIVDSYAKPLKEFIGDQESIQRDVITVNPTGKILLVSFKFLDGAKVFIKNEDLDRIDKYLFDTLGIKPSIQSTESTVQEAETKIDDIVFNAPVVPVGTEDQRNATDKLVDEFIAKNENNFKKLAVDNVDLLSTIDKTLEFIKAKFGTPFPVTSISNVASAPSQTQPIGGIDDYKLIKFIGEDGERQVIEFKKFKTGKNANVFKYLIGDVFLDTTSSNADADFVYKQIIGAQEGGVNAGYIHYIDSYPGKVGIGLTWDSRVKKISVGDFEGKIESGEWTSVPGANANLKSLNSQTQSSSSSQTIKKGRFSLGDTVKISRSSQYYGINASNPKNEEGEIIDIAKGSTHPIKVKWANGKSNTYPTKDLVLVTSVQSSTATPAPAVTTTSSGSTTANVGDTVTFYASREKTNLTGIVKSIITGTDGKPYLRINVNGKFYLKQQGSVTKV